jgi:hypothetical protein
MRKHFVRSPDYADSCCFAVELARRLGATAGTILHNQAESSFAQIQAEYDDIILDPGAFSYSSDDDGYFARADY